MREREVMMIYTLKKQANFKLSTPVGVTEEVGSKLCYASTGKVNEGLEIEEILYPEEKMQAIIFVEDSNDNGGKEVLLVLL